MSSSSSVAVQASSDELVLGVAVQASSDELVLGCSCTG